MAKSDLESALGDLRAAIDSFTREARRLSSGSGGGVRVTIADDTKGGSVGFDRVFVGLGAVLDAMPSALKAAEPEIRAGHRAVFTTEGAAGRGRWRPLKPSTIEERRRLGYGPGPILKRTGALERHVLSTPAVVSRIPGGYQLRIAPDANVNGVRKYRALAMGHGRIPARPMVALGPQAATKVTSAISRYLRARAASGGLGG